MRETTVPGPSIERLSRNDGTWEIVLRNPKGFEEALGRDVLREFCRCFVQADRLTSIISLQRTCTLGDDSESAARARDRNTLLWFAVGTLRELALAIHCLRCALKKRECHDPASELWLTLGELEDRLKVRRYRILRNRVAFHVDPKVIDKGLCILLEQSHLTLARGNGRMLLDGRLTLGHEALQNGLGVNLDAYGNLIDRLMEDTGSASGAIQKAFMLATAEAGIPVGDR